MKLIDMLHRYTVAPAKILRLDKGSLRVGADADVTVLDPDRPWVFLRKETRSKSINNPFYGWPLRGLPLLTIVGGRVAHRDVSLTGGEPIPA